MAPPRDERVAVVTGANRGIGREIARQLVRRGVTVVLTARDRKNGEAAAEELAREGDVRFFPLDVTSAESCAAMAQFIERELGRLDVLINNAGILDRADAPAAEVAPELVARTFETNTLGALRVAQALLPLLRKSPDGRIINVSSGMGAFSDAGSGYAAYRISKTALNYLTATLAEDLRGRVAVNSVCPGWVRTDMGGAGAPRDVSEGADTPVWLALDAKRGVTGKFFRDRKEIDW